MLQLCVCRDIEHLGSLRSTQEARVALCCAWSNSYGSFVLSTLPTSSISRHTHADSWTNCRNPFYHPFKRPTMFIHEDMHWVKCLWKSWVMNKTSHPRRPRGGQSGLGIMCDESFQAHAEKPLGTDYHRTISKRSRECWLLIGHKKCFVLLCPIGEQHLLSSFREFVHDCYWLDHGLSVSCTKDGIWTQSGIFQFDINATSQNTSSLYTTA